MPKIIDPVIRDKFNALLQSGLRYGNIRPILEKEFPGQVPPTRTFNLWEHRLRKETGFDQNEAVVEAAVARRDRMIADDLRQLDRMNTDEAIIRRDEAYDSLEGRDLLEYDLRNTRDIHSRAVWQIEADSRREQASTQNQFMLDVVNLSNVNIENVNIGGPDGSSDSGDRGDPGVGTDSAEPQVVEGEFRQVGSVQEAELPAPPGKAD